MIRHLPDFASLGTDDARALLAAAGRCAAQGRECPAVLAGSHILCAFLSPSTRSLLSFSAAISLLGGTSTRVGHADLQLSRGESLHDTARVFSAYHDAIVIRTPSHDDLLTIRDAATVPVINALTDRAHPCQVLADLLTCRQHFGRLDDLVIAWVGDGNNMARTWVEAAVHFPFHLRIASPGGYGLESGFCRQAGSRGARLVCCTDPARAVEGAHVVMTDTWVSINDVDGEQRHQAFRPFQVTTDLMARARSDAVFLHCLPACRGREVEGAVIDSACSLVFRQAANRLPAQMAVLAWVLDRTLPLREDEKSTN